MAKKASIILPSSGLTSLHDMLLANDKNGLLKPSTMSLGFPTGYLPFDFRNGYVVQNFDDDDNVVGSYNNLGFFGGTFNTIIGKSGVAKTTFVAQACANMQRYIEQKFGMLAEIYHFDVEQASNYTRIKKVTNLPVSKIKKGYYIYQDSTHIEDIFTIICRIAMTKEANKEKFMMKTGIRDEFNQEICTYVPTFLIVDSLPSLSIKENEMSDEIAGSTYANRVAKQLARFYKSLGPIVKRYNLVVFAINHINTKIEINPMAKTQPQLMYLKMDEALPCGRFAA